MTNIIKCPSCNGSLRIMSLGMIYKTCVQCKGIGHIYEEENKISPPENNNPITAPKEIYNQISKDNEQQAKRGRKRKEV